MCLKDYQNRGDGVKRQATTSFVHQGTVPPRNPTMNHETNPTTRRNKGQKIFQATQTIKITIPVVQPTIIPVHSIQSFF